MTIPRRYWQAALLALALGALAVTPTVLKRRRATPVPTRPPAADPPPAAPTFQDITELTLREYRFVTAGPSLTVYRKDRRLLRLSGKRFFLPVCADEGTKGAMFRVAGSDYLVLGERDPGAPKHGAWHVLQLAPRFRYVQGIRTAPYPGCPLLAIPWAGELTDVSLNVEDCTLRGFDSDSEEELDFGVSYSFVRGEFRPDYTTTGEPPDYEFLREMRTYVHFDATPPGCFAPPLFWSTVLDLVTEGNAGAATEFADRAWPADQPHRARAMAAFVGRLRTSRHYRGLLRANRNRMPR